MSIVQQGDLPFLMGFAGAVVVITTAVALIAGRRIARRSKPLAVAVSAAACPLLFLLLALFGAYAAPGAEAPSFVFGGLVLLAVISLPIALVTSALLLLRPRRGRSPITGGAE